MRSTEKIGAGEWCLGRVTRSLPIAVPELPRETARGVITERHYAPQDLAQLWDLSADTVRRLFEREPGVLVIEQTGNRARRYRTMRIPESVAARVHRRLTNPLTMPTR
jgi:hypothetical protein